MPPKGGEAASTAVNPPRRSLLQRFPAQLDAGQWRPHRRWQRPAGEPDRSGTHGGRDACPSRGVRAVRRHQRQGHGPRTAVGRRGRGAEGQLTIGQATAIKLTPRCDPVFGVRRPRDWPHLSPVAVSTPPLICRRWNRRLPRLRPSIPRRWTRPRNWRPAC